jgi:hypothetical protein
MAESELARHDAEGARFRLPVRAFLFDVKLFVLVHVHAPDEAAAREMLAKALDGAKLEGGSWPNGQPVTMDAGIDGEADLIEVDGEAV